MAGDWTFAEFKALLKMELGEVDIYDSHSVMGDLPGEWINTAYMTLTTRDMFWGKRMALYFPELMTSDATQSTIDGRNYISTPSDCLHLEGLWDTTNDTQLKGISWKKYRTYSGRTDTDSEGEPTEYVRRGSRIYLYRQPDDTYAMTIYYRKRVNRLDGDSYDTTEIGEEWDEPILRLAVVQSLIRLKRYDEVKIHKEEFHELVEGLASIYNNEKKDWDNRILPSITGLNTSDYS